VNSYETRIFIVSANRLLREVLARIFKSRSRICVNVMERLSGDSESAIVSWRPDVLLLDTIAPLFENDVVIRALREELPLLRIVLMGMESDDRLFLESVKRGVAGYLLRDAAASEIVAAVRAVARDEAVCPPQFSRALFDFVANNHAGGEVLPMEIPFPLTRRECQLVPLIARGLTNKEIAAHFNLSEQTIKNHVHRICHKVGADGRLEIAEVCRAPRQLH